MEMCLARQHYLRHCLTTKKIASKTSHRFSFTVVRIYLLSPSASLRWATPQITFTSQNLVEMLRRCVPFPNSTSTQSLFPKIHSIPVFHSKTAFQALDPTAGFKVKALAALA